MGNHVSLCHSTIVAEKLGFEVTTRLQEAKIVWVNRAEELDRAKWTCVRESQAMKEREARREGGIGEKERKVAVKRPGSRGTRGQGPSAGEGGQDLGQAAPMLGHDLNSPVAMLGQSHINFRQAVSSSALGENKPPLIGRGGGAGASTDPFLDTSHDHAGVEEPPPHTTTQPPPAAPANCFYAKSFGDVSIDPMLDRSITFVNRFPQAFHITRKDLLVRNLTDIRKRMPGSCLNFFPTTTRWKSHPTF